VPVSRMLTASCAPMKGARGRGCRFRPPRILHNYWAGSGPRLGIGASGRDDFGILHCVFGRSATIETFREGIRKLYF
jgi:hypothetical protein